MTGPTLSIIIPAFNEEGYLPSTLSALRVASENLPCELIVVDNESTDSTRDVAEHYGATVITERVHNIARVRNTGANAAQGDVLVFVDADTTVPASLLGSIASAMQAENCMGGAVAVAYSKFDRAWMAWYLKGWAFWARFFNMKQGAAQFCRRTVFQEIRGYDDTIHMGEDIEFYWRLSRHARRSGGYVQYIKSPRVVTSSRRFDKMSVARVLLLSHPLVIRLSWRRRWPWKQWYDVPVR